MSPAGLAFGPEKEDSTFTDSEANRTIHQQTGSKFKAQLTHELLEELLERSQRGRLSSVVVVSVDVEDLLSGHGQHSRENALLQNE